MLYDGTDSPVISVAFDTGKQGIFTLGISTLGGTDVLGSFGTTWTTIPASTVRGISIRRGRTREDQSVQPGTCTLTLDNRSGNYDPDNPASPYVWSGYSILTKGLGMRVTAGLHNPDGSVRTNLVTNPSFEIDASGWSSAQSTMARAITYSYTGSASFAVTMTSSVDSNIGNATISAASTGSHVFSMYFYVPVGSAAAGRTVSVGREAGTATVSGATSATATLVAGSWVRASYTVNVTAIGTLTMVARVSGTLSTISGAVIYLDAAMLERSATVGTYFDGSIAGYQWNGTANASTSSSVDYSLYRGYLEQISTDQSLDPVATITFTDALAQLSQQNLAAVAASFSGDTTATRVGRVLDAIGWSATLRSLSGSRTMQPTTYGDTALTLSEQASTCEFGRLFANRTGSIVLMPYESTLYTPQRLAFSDDRSTGTIEYSTIKTDPGAKYLYNVITLTQTTGSVVTYTNANSTARYGSYPKAITAPLLDGGTASTLAQIIGDRYALPSTRVEQIEFDAYGVAGEWPDLMQTELGDRATVTRTTVDGRLRIFNSLIESINHDLTPNSWHVSMDLSPGIKGNFFTLGSSLLGGTDVLYY